MELRDLGTSPLRPRGHFVVGRNGIPSHGENRARPRITRGRLGRQDRRIVGRRAAARPSRRRAIGGIRLITIGTKIDRDRPMDRIAVQSEVPKSARGGASLGGCFMSRAITKVLHGFVDGKFIEVAEDLVLDRRRRPDSGVDRARSSSTFDAGTPGLI